MAGQVVVTGAAGHVGHRLTEELLGRGVSVKAVGRSAERLAPLVAKGAEAVVGNLDDRGLLERAFGGAQAVFAMVPPDYTADDLLAKQARLVATLLEAVRAAGVPRVVALSSVGAELPAGTGPIVTLHRLEAALAEIPGLHHVSLRAAYFMENHLGSLGLIKAQGINGSPLLPDLPLPQVATRDIAAAAAALLAQPAFVGGSVRYVLGPRDYTMIEATAILGRAIGKPDLAYVRFDDEPTKQALVGAGLSPGVADLFLEMDRAFNERRVHLPERSPENTTPTTLEQFAADTFAPAYGA
jgi:uncharacterized protein YbjT (DUF2867 family)